MPDRITNLAKLLINHSCELRPGERVLVEAISAPNDIVIALLREAKLAGATPLVTLKDDKVIRELCSTYDENDAKFMASCELTTLKQVQAFISIRAINDPHEYSAIPPEKVANILQNYIQPVHFDYRNNNLRWVSLRWPTAAMADRAGVSKKSFENFFFDVCLVDYAQMEEAMDPLAALIEQTSLVRIVGPGKTDLTFSIEGMSAYKSVGKHNIPDGELLTAPVKESVSGHICFNIPSTYYGVTFEGVSLEFRSGKAVEAVCGNNSRRLNEILDQDEGARFVGEFAFGLHPLISNPINDILFDEKIAGSIHLALGNAYGMCDNGNRSAIHWDLILLQTAAMGGGSVFLDDVLIRADGRFVLPELASLNPESLQ